ncbi:MAG: MFS transporter, partial [Gammaproteobacteria bacterium]|nr:MFS transporter [Gammaproteobacteria bacterium]
PDPEFATLPISMMVIGAAVGTVPAALTMRWLGRKAGMAVGIGIALIGAVIACVAAINGNFWLFISGMICIGLNAAFTQQGRFIILENAETKDQQADGLSLALLANLLAAVTGPQLGAYGKDVIQSPAGYAGSFMFAGIVLVLSLIALSAYQNKPAPVIKVARSNRSLISIARQPVFIIAAGSAAIGYGVMSLVMTATPIAMHKITGHPLQLTTMVIQTHIVAMFLPSLISGRLIKKGLTTSLLLGGLAIYALVAIIGFNGVAVMHYWWALLLLGLGWNLLFVTSTSLLPRAYNANEGFKAQALNDFLVFSSQAVAAFAAGWILFNMGWNSLLGIALASSLTWALCIGVLHLSTTNLTSLFIKKPHSK